jgi:DNA-binding transcriptional ArsR family regulator
LAYLGLVTDTLDAVFKALADPTRRLLLDRLRERGRDSGCSTSASTSR